MRPRALAKEEVAAIRKWYRPGVDGSDMQSIADHYGISIYTVHNVIHRRGAYKDASDDAVMTRRGIAQSFDGSAAGWQHGTRLSVSPFNQTYVDVVVEEDREGLKIQSRARLTRTDARRLAIALLTLSEGLE